jgi:transcriptional regulator with XRE-family HTH domain
MKWLNGATPDSKEKVGCTVMNGQLQAETIDLAGRIGRLVQERGWTQDEFARQAGLNRQTARQILRPDGERRLRNDTVCRCARALGMSVHELRNAPLSALLARFGVPSGLPATDASISRLYEEATQPELQGWLERNPERANRLTPEEIDELLSLQGTGGPLSSYGVDHFVELIERRRKIVEQVETIACTEYLELLEQFVSLLHEKVQPYRERR